MSNSKWKSKLLSSSIPLEFEVAKLLAKKGFAVEADFTYPRDDAGIVKDFSVDIHAVGYPPFTPSALESQLTLLVECKQRHRGVQCLFFPDPNDEGFSRFTAGCTLRVVDQFSLSFFASNATVPFDHDLTFCYKGVEVDTSTGAVYDTELRHGLSQLQYALPRLLSEHIRFNVFAASDDNLPLLFCPILLTTSEIWVAHEELATSDIESADSLSDIGSTKPYVIAHIDLGPDFERHRARECSGLNEMLHDPALKALDAERQKRGEDPGQLPSALCTDLSRNGGRSSRNYFAQVVVCSATHFASLVDVIKKTAAKATSFRRSRKAKHRTPPRSKEWHLGAT